MAHLNYTYDHKEQLDEIASQKGVSCPVCGSEELVPRKSYGKLTLASTIKVSRVCVRGCDMPVYIQVKLNDRGQLEPY